MADSGSFASREYTALCSPTEVAKDGFKSVIGGNNKLTIRCPLLDIKKFDLKTANLFASKKKWDELKGYLEQFGSKDSVVNLFIQFGQRVIELIKDVNYGAALSVFENEIIPLVQTSADDLMIKPLTDHLLSLQEEVKTRPLVEADKTLLQPAPPCCLACGLVIPARKEQEPFKHKVTDSEEGNKLKINLCDCLTPYLPRRVNASKFKKGEASGSAAMLALTDSSKSSLKRKESGCSGKRRKFDDESESCGSCGEDDEAISAEKELCETIPAHAIGNVFAKSVDLLTDAKKLDSSVSAGVYAICIDQNGIIVDLACLIGEQSLYLIMRDLSGLERKTAELFPFTDALPSVFCSKILDFVDATIKLRSSLKLFCAKSVHAPTVYDLGAELVKINFEINKMIKCSAVGSGDNQVIEILKAQNEEVAKVVKLFHEDKVSAESLMKVLSCIAEVNEQFLPLTEFFPKELPSKLLGMSVMFCKLWHLSLPLHGSSASQLEDA